MSKSMLDSIIRSLVGVDPKYHGIVLDFTNKLKGENADEYRKRVATDLREPIVPPPPLDTIIRVDRSARPSYPDWVKEVKHPELECTGPAEFDLANVEQYLHDGQMGGGYVTGNTIYDHLKSEGMLESCLSLQDGLAIQAKGIEAFRQFFGGKVVFLWRSVVLDRDGSLHVPYLYERGGRVVVGWRWLGRGWDDLHPALRLAS